MNFDLNEEHRAMQDMARRYAEREVTPTLGGPYR